MVVYIFKRLLWIIPVVLGVMFLIFTLLWFTPGDPSTIVLGANSTVEEREEWKDEHGLNDPYVVQLGRFYKEVLVDHSLGTSYITNKSIGEEIVTRLPYTMLICYVGIGIGLVIGVLLGLIAATNQNTWKDNLCMVFGMVGLSMPNFWFALMMIMLLSMQLGILPVSGISSWQGYVIPCICGAFNGLAQFSKLTRSSMLENIRQDYVTTARAKGQTERKVIFNHAFRNSLLPIVSSIGQMMAASLGGTVVIENIFSIPGLGSYLITSINNRDYTAVRGTVLVLAIIFTVISLGVDLLYGVVDPRLKTMYARKKRKKKIKKQEGGEMA